MKNARAKRAKILFFIVKYANLWGFCCRRRRGCLSSLTVGRKRTHTLFAKRRARSSLYCGQIFVSIKRGWLDRLTNSKQTQRVFEKLLTK